MENHNKQEKKNLKQKFLIHQHLLLLTMLPNGVKVSVPETFTLDAGKADEIEAKLMFQPV